MAKRGEADIKGIIMGIGNEMRGDDAIGLLVAKALKESIPCPVILAEDVPENYLDIIRSYHPAWVLLVDAVEFGGDPGDIMVLNLGDEGEASFPTISTHRPSLRILEAYIRKEIGADVWLLGIQPKAMSFGAPVSEEVKGSLRKAVEMAISLVEGLEEV